MALSDDRQIFGLHSMVPISRSNGLPYGILKILGEAELSLKAEKVENRGGSSPFPWAVEVTQIDSSFKCNVRSSPNFLYQLYAGANVTETAASATGTCGTLANSVGTSCMSATTGIASAGLKSGKTSDLKFGRYYVKVVSATTVDVYCDTDIEFNSGDTTLEYQDDDLKFTESAITITASTAVEIPGTGIELTGGSGTIGMTVDDVAYFDVVPEHGGISDIDIGQSGLTFPEHELVLLAKKRSDGTMCRIHAFKAASSAGMVMPFGSKEFSISDLETTLLFDNSKGKVASIRAITPA